VEYVYSALCSLDVNWLKARVGIIGCGNVGGLLYRRLKLQGVECVCYDPFLSLEQNPDLTSLEDVLDCDLICLHTPLTKSGPHPSFHLLGEAELRRLKPGAVLLNAGRGPVVDNQALNRVLAGRPDLRVVLDVWEPEPDISLSLLDQVAIGTPHIAGYSHDGKLKGTEMIYQALCRHLKVSPGLSLRELVPPLADNRLQCPPGDDWQSLKSLVASVYDIGADDSALRQLAVDGVEGFGRGFDGLRKHYPVRREFHNYRVEPAQGQALSPRLKTWLTQLGFGVADSN
jgi:erythronate-4-phosphate dehydrogenase